MNNPNVAVIIVALISIISTYLSGRAARTAAKLNADASTVNSRTQAEIDAYNRARAMDIETINIQKADLEGVRRNNKELREKLRKLEKDNQYLHEENDSLRRRVSRLEQQLGENHGQETV